MRAAFNNVSISGICTILPSNSVNFDDEIEQYAFTRQQSLKLKKVFSLDKRRVVTGGVCTSDLAEAGLKWIFNAFPELKKNIGALLFVSQTPDYLIPPTSNILQGKFGLPDTVLCMDINQGCAGFIVGLYQAASIINTSDVNSVLLINGDVLSRKVSKFDRNSNPLVGDAAAVTLISRSNTRSDNKLVFNIKMDGTGAFALHIPAGGARLPTSEDTSKLMLDDAGNRRSLDNIVMKGDQVFSFVQSVVPGIIEETMEQAKLTHDDIWKYVLHQPNRFMLQKIAEALKVDYDKIPSNIVEEFGNSSGVTVPLVITHNLSEEMMSKNVFKTVLCGFGVGLTWGCAVADLGNMLFCKQLEV